MKEPGKYSLNIASFVMNIAVLSTLIKEYYEEDNPWSGPPKAASLWINRSVKAHPGAQGLKGKSHCYEIEFNEYSLFLSF